MGGWRGWEWVGGGVTGWEESDRVGGRVGEGVGWQVGEGGGSGEGVVCVGGRREWRGVAGVAPHQSQRCWQHGQTHGYLHEHVVHFGICIDAGIYTEPDSGIDSDPDIALMRTPTLMLTLTLSATLTLALTLTLRQHGQCFKKVQG